MRRIALLGVTVLLAALASGCGWGQTGFSPGLTSSNDLEHAIGVGNVAGLVDRPPPVTGGQVLVVDNLLLAIANDGLHVYDRDACTTAQSLAGCSPRWSRAGVSNTATDGVRVFAGQSSGVLTALDLDGRPLWSYSAPSSSFVDRVAIADGFVLFSVVTVDHGSETDALSVFPVAGCGRATCQPTRTFTPLFSGGAQWTADAGRLVLVKALPTGDNTVVAYDLANGNELWRSGAGHFTSMASRDGVVYAVNFGPSPDVVQAFDATGATCTGNPTTCAPEWQLSAPSIAHIAAVSAHRLIATDGFSAVAYWFNTDPSGCQGVPRTCAPIAQSAPYTSPGTGPGRFALANGVLYNATADHLLAYDEAAAQGCTGTPKVCSPVFTHTFAGETSTPVIWDGHVYVFSTDGLHVFSLPA